MLLRKTAFPYIEHLESEEVWTAIKREAAALPEGSLIPWFQEGTYNGVWLVFPLYCIGPELLDAGGREICARNAPLMPETMKALGRIQGVTMASLSVLMPGCYIGRHRDHPDPKVYRNHLGLDIPPDCALRAGPHFCNWEEGRVIVFDGNFHHEAVNFAPRSRTILLWDVIAEYYPDAVHDTVGYSTFSLNADQRAALRRMARNKPRSAAPARETEMNHDD